MASTNSSPQRKISGFLEPVETEFHSRRKYFNVLDEYTLTHDAILKAADTGWAPCFVARSENKKRVRLNIISHQLKQIPYKDIHANKVESGCEYR